MKRNLLLLLFALCCMTQAWSQTYTMIDGIRYCYNSVSYTATVYPLETGKYSGDIVIPSSIRVSGYSVSFSVKYIGSNAFSGCTNLTSVTIPSSVTYIYSYAFSGCANLTSVTIPYYVTYIGEFVFSGCIELSCIRCLGSRPSTGAGIFNDVPDDMFILVPNPYLNDYQNYSPWNNYNVIGRNNDYYDFAIENNGVNVYYKITSASPKEVCVTNSSVNYNSYSGEVNIPSAVTYSGHTFTVTSIGSSAFRNCPNMTSVSLPNTITSIGEYAFYGCTSLSTITIPDYVTSIGSYAFQGCTNLSSLTIGNSLASIVTSAFSGCSNLATINWNAVNVTTFPQYASTNVSHPFYGCGITAVNFGGAVQSIPNHAFNGKTSLTSINIGASVTTIGDYAFQGCTGLASLSLGASVATIGQYAFSGCTGIASLTINALLANIGNYAFNNCSSINQALVLPPFVTAIGDRAFYGCSSITSLTMGINVNSIGDNAFNNCTNLASLTWNALQVTDYANGSQYAPFLGCTNLSTLTFGGTVRNIPDYAFMGTSISSMTLPNSLTSIGKYAFYGVASMTQELTVPNNVTSIGEYAFKGCTGISKVTFGSSLQSIGNYSFRECSGIVNDIIIPNAVETVGEGAFYSCSGVGAIALGSGVTTIGNLAFNNCSSLSTLTWNAANVTNYPTADNMLPFISCNNLTTINIGNAVTNIPAKAFYSCTTVTTANIGNHLEAIPDNAFYNCSSLSTVNIPNSVTSIGASAFKFCVGIASLSLPSSINAIGASAFDGCVMLPYMAVPEGVTAINDYTFQNCSSMSSASLPSSITTVGSSSFKNCVSLSTMRVFASEVPEANANAFENVSTSMNLQVPQASVSLYQAASPWSNFNITGVVSHTIAATASPAAGGTVSGTGQYAFGSTATLTATSNANYTFVNWTESGNTVSTEPHFSFTVTGDRTLTANFVYGTSYTITAASNPIDGGTVSGTGTYLENATATLTASASTGYSFVNWTENNNPVSTSATYSFTVTSDRSLVANFTAGGSNHWTPDQSLYPDNMSLVGQIQIDGENQAATTLEVGAFCGSQVRGSQRPQYIQSLDKYIVFLTIYGQANDEITFRLYDHQTGTELNLISPSSVTFTANGRVGTVGTPYNLNFISTVTINATADPTSGGTITGTGNYSIGNSVTLTATANSGYSFSNWTENGSTVSSDATYTFTASANRSLVANFIVSNHWIPDQSLYADNMSIIGVIQIDGVEQRTSNLEIGAFCGSEVRGSQRPRYYGGSLDRYIFFLTVYGQANDVITFKLYDHDLNQERDLTSPSSITFTANGTVGSVASPHVMNFTSTVAIAAACNPANAGIITGAADYPIGSVATLSVVANAGYSFKNWTLNGAVVSTSATYSFTVTEARTFIANFDIVHSRNLTSGWNWYSTYIDVSGASGLTMMENSLGNDGMLIKNQSKFVTYDYGLWFGELTSVAVEEMYMIQMSAAHTLNMSGSKANPSNHPITIGTGWKWIGYPISESMSIETAFGSFVPHDGDLFKSQAGFSQYYEGIGWLGELSTLTPGMGYMYQNTGNTSKTLIYSNPRGFEVLKPNVSRDGNHWIPDMYKYADNMSLIAVIDINGDEQHTENLEVGAFCNGEVRGSSRPIYIEQLDRYMIFLTVYGEQNDEIRFRLFDAESEEEYEGFSDNMILFAANGTTGSVSMPYVLNFGSMGIDEAAESWSCIYPNPASKGENIQLSNICERVEIFNSTGVKVAEYQNVECIKGIDVAGVYIIRVVNDGKVKINRLIIK